MAKSTSSSLRKIISGAQTGADQGGLEAAKLLGLETGGMMPAGCRTELGPMPELVGRFGLVISASEDYPPRTKFNVIDSDGTIIFGDIEEIGSRLTRKLCKERNKPCLVVDDFTDENLASIRKFVAKYKIRTLNVAGNRESKLPGLQEAVRDFLVEALAVERAEIGRDS